MRLNRPVLGVVLATVAATSQAQFNFDLNKLIETTKTVVSASRELPVDQEIELGRGLAGRLLGVMPLVRDPVVQQYVNDLGWWLVRQTERPNLPWRFAVTDTSALGAFATPGGHVVITRGLFEIMQDEHQLAGVLAHEIAHVVLKHHLQAIQREAQSSLFSDLGSQAVGAMTGDDGTLSAISRQVLSAGMEVYARGLPREDELEADAHGLVIAARGGYDPSGLGGLMFTLDAVDPSEPSYQQMSATHPSTRDRLLAIETALDNGLDRFASTLTDETRFDAMKARL